MGWRHIAEIGWVEDPFDTPIYDEVVAAMAGGLGIDVASYQGSPNWEAVRKANVTFVYIKASEGNSTSYKTLDSQYKGAKNVGLPIGLYHYAKPNLSAEANADAFATQINRLGAVAGHLPPCLDLEEGSGNLAGWAKAFITRLRAKTDCKRVVVYSGASFFKTNIGESWMDSDVVLWIAHYGRTPGQPGYLTPRVALHQFSSTGAVPGISGNVDLDQAIWPLSQLLTGAAPPEDEEAAMVMPWVLPAGTGMEKTIPVPLFPPWDGKKTAVMWMVTGWTVAKIKSLYYVRDQGPGLSPQQEGWGGTGAWDLVPDDRPSFGLPSGCTSVAVAYDSPHDIAVMIVHPAV